MSAYQFTADGAVPEKRDRWEAMKRGFRGRCPHCGQGKLFQKFLKPVQRCAICGEEFHHHRADDLPAYIVIFLVGHLVVAGLMSAEQHAEWPIVVHAILWPALTVILSLLLIQPVKGAIVGLQWAMRMHGFAGRSEEEEPHQTGRVDP